MVVPPMEEFRRGRGGERGKRGHASDEARFDGVERCHVRSEASFFVGELVGGWGT